MQIFIIDLCLQAYMNGCHRIHSLTAEKHAFPCSSIREQTISRSHRTSSHRDIYSLISAFQQVAPPRSCIALNNPWCLIINITFQHENVDFLSLKSSKHYWEMCKCNAETLKEKVFLQTTLNTYIKISAVFTANNHNYIFLTELKNNKYSWTVLTASHIIT